MIAVGWPRAHKRAQLLCAVSWRVVLQFFAARFTVHPRSTALECFQRSWRCSWLSSASHGSLGCTHCRRAAAGLVITPAILVLTALMVPAILHAA